MKDEKINNKTVKKTTTTSSVNANEEQVASKAKQKKENWFIQNCIQKTPLAFMLVTSTVVFTIAGGVYGFAKDGKLDVKMNKPMFASLTSLVNGLSDKKEENPYEFAEGEIDELIEEITADLPEEEGEIEQEQIGKEEETSYVTEFIKQKKIKVDSPYYSDPGLKALTTDYPYDTVGNEYFDDALFIGDSRIEGMSLYSTIKNATFYAKQGTTIYKILGEKIVDMNIDGKDKKVSVAKALKEKKFAKVYIMLGINELGYKTSEEFGEEYQKVVNVIKKLQPDAKIFVMAIMNVTEAYHKAEPVYNNVNINSKNVQIAKIADGKRVFYLDVNEAVCDKNGFVKSKYAWDGVHLKAEYYVLIDEFLKKHAIENNIKKESDNKEKKDKKENSDDKKEATDGNKSEETTKVNEETTKINEETTKINEETTKEKASQKEGE